jgi:hypothetical protein
VWLLVLLAAAAAAATGGGDDADGAGAPGATTAAERESGAAAPPQELPGGLFANDGPTFVFAHRNWTLYLPLVNERRSGKVRGGMGAGPGQGTGARRARRPLCGGLRCSAAEAPPYHPQTPRPGA